MSSRNRSSAQKPIALASSDLFVRCSCSECRAHSDGQPNLTPGRLIPRLEARDHMKDENRERVAKSLHETMFGKGGMSPRNPPLPYRSSAASPARDAPSSSPTPPILPQGILERIDELKTMCKQLKTPEKVLGERIPYFSRPPTREEYVKTSELSDQEVDALCELDPNISSNSSVIGYQQLLARTKRQALSAVQDDGQALRAQAKKTLKLVDQLQDGLRELLLQEWRLQRSALKQPGYYDSCELLTCVQRFPNMTLMRRTLRSALLQE